MRRDSLLRPPRALGAALLPLVLALALTACQPSQPVCNAAGALILGPAFTAADGALYASAGGGLSVLRAGTGALIWHVPASSGISNVPPLVADGMVVAVAGPGALVAFHVSDGSVVWHSQPVPRPETATSLLPPSLAFSGTVVYASASRDSVAAWRVADGTLLWQSPPLIVPSDPTYASGFAGVPEPVVAADAVYFSAGQSVHAVRAADGTLLWSSPVLQTENLYTPPVLADGRLFVAARDSSFYALDASTGAVLWHALDPDAAGLQAAPSYAPPALPTVQDGIVYYFAADGVRTLAADTGALLWHLTAAHPNAVPSPRLAGDALYVVVGSSLLALDPRTGAVKWHIYTQQDVEAPFFVDGDVIYTISASTLAAWRTSDGSSIWQSGVHLVGPTRVPQMAFDGGTLYVGTSGMYSCGGAIPPTVSAFRVTDGALLWQSSLPV